MEWNGYWEYRLIAFVKDLLQITLYKIVSLIPICDKKIGTIRLKNFKTYFWSRVERTYCFEKQNQRQSFKLRVNVFVSSSLCEVILSIHLLSCWWPAGEFGFIGSHSRPDAAPREIDALVDVYDDMVRRWKIKVVIHFIIQQTDNNKQM